MQEVNAVTLAVERLHPDVGSVVELGGQDAKIIIFKEAKDDKGKSTGKTAIASMNDKCASGTGATIDKCFMKVGMPSEDAMKLHFDDSKLHHVAAKCGVFAETDIVNLVKASIPSAEIMCSLADAIVMQNLSVLTRGNTLRHKVLLLGGPNTYLPFLQECWRKRIPKTWEDRGYDYPKDVPIEELIIIPENAQYYAAFGAVMYGLHEDASVGIYHGLEKLNEFIFSGRKSKLGDSAGPPLSRDERRAGGVPRAVQDPQVHPGDADARHQGARRDRHGRRLDVVEGGARRRAQEHPQEGVPALEGQPDPGREGDPGAPAGLGHRRRAASWRCWASAPPATPPTCWRRP